MHVYVSIKRYKALRFIALSVEYSLSFSSSKMVGIMALRHFVVTESRMYGCEEGRGGKCQL